MIGNAESLQNIQAQYTGSCPPYKFASPASQLGVDVGSATLCLAQAIDRLAAALERRNEIDAPGPKGE